MLDLRRIREETDLVKAGLARRGNPAHLEGIDRALELDERRRALIGEVDALRARRNEESQKVATLTREKRGTGFCYRNGDGALIRDAGTRGRIQALGIPPAWREVRIAPDARAHIQALGMDEAGRDQYIYHPDWELRRERTKQRRNSQSG